MIILKSDLSLGSCLSGTYASLYAVTKLAEIVAYALLAYPYSYGMLNKSFKPLALLELFPKNPFGKMRSFLARINCIFLSYTYK